MALIRDLIGNQFRDDPASTGDVMSNYFGGGGAVNDPQANVRPKSTTINYNDDGGVEITHKQTIDNSGAQEQAAPPQELVNLRNSSQLMNGQPNPAMAPARAPWLAPSPQQVEQAVPGSQPFVNTMQAMETPTPMPQARPVAPQVAMQPPPDTFNRMVQAESVGQQNGPNGQILTSPKGAVGIAQILPSTARQPGYNIIPATPAELATPEGNLAFGQRYFDGMFKKFGSDPEKAAAAYNAGPGTIEKAMLAADAQGGDWKDYIPAETKNYLTNVFPKQKEEQANRFKPMLASIEGTRIDADMTPTEQVVHHLALNSRDVSVLGQGAYAGDHLLDPVTKKAYADQHAEVMKQNQLEKKAEVTAQKLIESGGAGMQRALKDPSEEGSYLRAYMFQRLGLTDLAKNEQQKLGAGDMWAQTMVNGTPAWVKFNGQGAPIKGYNTAGALNESELINAMNVKGVTQHTGKMQDIKTKKIYYEQTTPAGPRLVDTQGQIYSGPSENLRAYGIGSDIETKNVIDLNKLRNKLAYASPYEAAKLIAEFEFKNGELDPEEKTRLLTPQGTTPIYQGGVPPAATPVEPTTVSEVPAPAAPTPMGGAIAPQAPAQAPAPAVRAPAPAVRPVAPTTMTGTSGGPRYREPGFQNETKSQFGERQASYGRETTAFSKYHNEDLIPKADAGNQVSRIRKDQINGPDGILANPEIAGILQGGGGASQEMLSILRDMVTGDSSITDLSARVESLGLTGPSGTRLKEVLYRQIGLQNQLAPLTLRANAGPGAISEGEHKINKTAGVDITRQPLYSGLSLMTRSQFINDQASSRAAFKDAHQELTTTAKFNTAWSAEKRRQDETYDKIYAARAAYVAKYNPNGSNTNAIVEAYKHYPVPEWNADTQKWDLKGFSQKAARPSLDKFKE